MNKILKLSVVIQAGGESRRMGQNKALIPFLGKPLIQSVITRVAPIADELFITCNKSDELKFLQIPLVTDISPGQGALSGLYTALSAAKYDLVAVIACDMPFVNSSLLIAEKDALLDLNYNGAVPQTSSGYEPFHAVYCREKCLIAIKDTLDAGQKRADSWFSKVRIRFFSPEQVAKYDPSGEAFININSHTELVEAEAYANQKIAKLSLINQKQM